MNFYPNTGNMQTLKVSVLNTCNLLVNGVCVCVCVCPEVVHVVYKRVS